MDEILKKDTLYPEDIKILYNEYGLSYEQIAVLLFTTKKIVEHLAYRQYKKLVKKPCKNCNQHFFTSPYSRTDYCSRTPCEPLLYKDSKNKRAGKSRSSKKDEGRIREYSSDSLYLIAGDIMGGCSLQWMAKEYDRDIDDLTKYIDRVTADGSLAKMQRQLNRMRSDTELARRGNQLL